MKKATALFCVFLMIFSLTAGPVAAASRQALFVTARTADDSVLNGDDPSTPTDPEDPTDPPTDPTDPPTDPEEPIDPPPTDPVDPPVTPDPTPVPPDPTPVTPPSDNSSNTDDSVWYDDSSDYDDNTADDDTTDETEAPADPTPSPTPTPSALPAGTEYIDGPYPMTLTTDNDTLNIALNEKAYTISEDKQAGSTTVVAFNKDALNTAIDTGTAKLAEKQKTNAKLKQFKVTVSPITADKLITSNTTISIPVGSLKKLPKDTATLTIPAGNTTYTLTAGFIDDNTLKSYGDDDTLRLMKTASTSLANKEYTISDIVYTALDSPFAVAAEVLKTNGEHHSLSAFNTPLTFMLTLDDTQKKALTGSASLCAYKSSSDSLNPLVSNYNKKEGTISVDLNGPDNLVLMTKADGTLFNPLYIIIPVIILVLAVIIYLIAKRKKRPGIYSSKKHKPKKEKKPARQSRKHTDSDALFREEDTHSSDIDLSQFDLHDRFEDDE